MTGPATRSRRAKRDARHAGTRSHLSSDGVYSLLVLIHLGLGVLLALGRGITRRGLRRGAIAIATVLPLLALPALGLRLRFLVQLRERSLEEITKHPAGFGRHLGNPLDRIGRVAGLVLLAHRVLQRPPGGCPRCPRGRRDDASAARTRGAGAPRLPGSGLRASSTPCVRPGALVRVETRVSRSESRRRPASAKTGTKKLAGDERRGLEMTLWSISSALRRRTPGSDAGVSKMNSAGFQICTERASDGGPVCDVAGARAPSRARPPPFFARDPIRDRADAAP